jgi:hypothetical protein
MADDRFSPTFSRSATAYGVSPEHGQQSPPPAAVAPRAPQAP